MKIGTQLIAGAVTIGAILATNLGIVFIKSDENDIRGINYAGVVRGGTQRIVKLELIGETDQALVSRIELMMDSLINGNEELKLKVSTHDDFTQHMEVIQQKWNSSLKPSILRYRQDPSASNQEILITHSEEMFELTNEAVEEIELYAEANLQQLKLIDTFVALVSLIALGVIVAGSLRISKTLNLFTSGINESSDDIASKVETQEAVANEQANSVSQTTTTVDLLGETSRRSAAKAEESAKSASTALSLAETGAQTVEETRVGMESLKERVREIAEQIINLSEQTEQIAGVSELVGDLANQTNMLALNAAVEAARAGEYGKGFGVVAGEIRKLADQSRKSADQINSLVTDIQAAMNTAVMVTDEGKKTAESSIELALNTAESFIGVKDAVNNVFTNTSDISEAAKQQAVGIQEILAAVNALNLGAMDTAADMAEVKTSTVSLKQSAEELKAIV
ncbi:MAG: methyl-accepting chemotaxis protein [Cyanobacteria bacterium J06621_8]